MKPYRLLPFLLGLFCLVGSAKADGGDVLQRIVRLPAAKATIYSLLGKISEQSGCLFIYDSRIINNDSIVKVRKKTCTVRQAVHEITGNRNLELRVLGNHILITRPVPTSAGAIRKSAWQHFSVLWGTLLDKETGAPVPNASVTVEGTSIGNISNQSGEFRLHLPDSLRHRALTFSHVGYVPQSIPADVLEERDNVLSLVPRVIPLQEVLIRLVEPKKLLREMMEFRAKNYSSSPVYLTTFYREGVRLKDKFQSLTEAVFKVYKSSVLDADATDQVKLLKMSRIDNRESTDSLIAKIRSGVEACLELDIMKNIPDFLSFESDNSLYVYTSGDIVTIDGRNAHVVSFEQRRGIKEPLFCGELYIDSENSALLRARFEIQPRFVEDATRIFVVRQAPKIKLTTRKVVYTVSYKPWNGIYYVHHIRGELLFRIKRKRFLSSNSMVNTWFEMVTCHIDKEGVTRFPRRERLPAHLILADADYQYDDSFWDDFNIIPLEEELSDIIKKVALKIEQTDASR